MTAAAPEDSPWTGREALLVRLVDSLVATRDIPDDLWAELDAEFSDVQLLDLIVLCGWYQAISQLCRALRIDLESTAPRISDYGGPRPAPTGLCWAP